MMQERQKNMTFPDCKQYPEGGKSVKEVLPLINDAMQTKNGIVPDSEIQTFRNFVNVILSENGSILQRSHHAQTVLKILHHLKGKYSDQ